MRAIDPFRPWLPAVALCVLAAAAPHDARAEVRSLASNWLDLSYDTAQLPTDRWRVEIGADLPIVYQQDGQWQLVFGGPLRLEITPLQPDSGPSNLSLGHVDLQLQFKAPFVLPLGAGTSLVSIMGAQATSVSTSARFWVPEHAQLLTALGHDQLSVTAMDGQVQAAEQLLQPGAPFSFSGNVVGSDTWTSAPAGAGSWQLSIDENLVGANYRVASSDPQCGDLSCMPLQRGAADLQSLTVWIPVSYEFVSATPVPEPPSALLLAGGLLGLALRRLR